MKLLKVRFKNLNSLVGSWTIDFQAPEYLQSGIFAITGPTGAGKTTILDAICLALFARTPRLDRIGKSQNELMARNTGECMAEVTFRTHEGTFRCLYSQIRARKKPDGNLQQPTWEISNMETGEMLIGTNRLTDVESKIVETLGMDYHQFLRAVLLAQGEFQSFLKSDLDSRAILLEKITGTEIYTTISQKVFERFNEESKKLDDLKNQIKGVDLPTEEQLAERQTHMAEAIGKLKQTKAELETIQTQLNQLEAIANQEQEITILTAAQTQNLQEIENFADQQAQLERDRKALALQPDFSRWETANQLATETETKLKKSCDDSQKYTEQLKKATDLRLERERDKAESARLLAEENRLVVEVRTLDQQVQAARNPLAEAQLYHSSLSQKLDGAQHQLTQHQHDRKDTQTKLETARQYQTDHACDEALVESLAAVFQSIDLLEHKRKNLETARNLNLEAEKLRVEKRQTLDNLTEKNTRLREEAQLTTTQIDEQKLLLTQALEEKTEDQWLAQLNDFQNQYKLWSELASEQEAITTTDQKLHQYQLQLNETESQLKEINQHTEVTEQRLQTLAGEMALLDKLIQTVTSMRQLDDWRQQLVDGQPCPLCQSIVHLDEIHIPPISEEQAKLAQARQEEALLQKELKILARNKGKAEVQIQNLGQIMETLTGEIGGHTNRQTELLAILQTNPDTSTAPAAQVSFFDSQISAVNVRLQRVRAIRTRIETLNQTMESCRKTLDQLAAQVSQAKTEYTIAEEKFNSTSENVRMCETDLATQLAVLTDALTPYYNSDAIGRIKAEIDWGKCRQDLQQRQTHWKANLELLQQLFNRVKELDTTIANHEKNIEQTQAELALSAENVRQKQEILQTLTRQRTALYGNKNPDEELKRLGTVNEQAILLFEQADKQVIQLETNLKSTEALAQQQKTELEKKRHIRNQLLLTLTTALTEAGFADLTDFTSAHLVESERIRIQKQHDELTRKQTELAATLTAAKTRLEQLNKSSAVEASKEDLTAAMAQKQEQRDLLASEIGRHQQFYDDYQVKRRQFESTLQQRDLQQNILNRWTALKELIGSRDGASYRKLVQRISLEILLDHANQQLHQFSNRYSLVLQDVLKPKMKNSLEFLCVDSFQANQIRPVDTLSGGESFLISLALALGLSKMSSNRIDIESLFLDEGFGTLDKDTLDNALDTLSEFQALDGNGKTIGIISHVEALKERITTQITVTPAGMGISRLTGPGVHNSSVNNDDD